ncbi:hypothetical protein HEP87_55775 [Streptomyces sp. S1D4-11]|nr:transposase [Streptomyces sp. S1D4-11]QIZ01213.1 transposase [Streptomyces sp. S1D4-11]
MAGEHLPVQLACRVLRVAESVYYAWRDRPPSNRLVKHAWLTEAIVGIHTASRGTYGSRRVHAELGLGLRPPPCSRCRWPPAPPGRPGAARRRTPAAPAVGNPLGPSP